MTSVGTVEGEWEFSYIFVEVVRVLVVGLVATGWPKFDLWEGERGCLGCKRFCFSNSVPFPLAFFSRFVKYFAGLLLGLLGGVTYEICTCRCARLVRLTVFL